MLPRCRSNFSVVVDRRERQGEGRRFFFCLVASCQSPRACQGTQKRNVEYWKNEQWDCGGCYYCRGVSVTPGVLCNAVTLPAAVGTVQVAGRTETTPGSSDPTPTWGAWKSTRPRGKWRRQHTIRHKHQCPTAMSLEAVRLNGRPGEQQQGVVQQQPKPPVLPPSSLFSLLLPSQGAIATLRSVNPALRIFEWSCGLFLLSCSVWSRAKREKG